MKTRKAYPSDISEQEWAWIEPLLPTRCDPRGAKAKHSRRELLNAIFYVVRQEIVWEALPHDFPAYKTVYDYFRKLNRWGGGYGSWIICAGRFASRQDVTHNRVCLILGRSSVKGDTAK